jgi:hypothetical protein
MAKLEDLPNELLTSMFEILRDWSMSPKSLANVSSCSHRLHHLANRVLYQNFQLTSTLIGDCSLQKYVTLSGASSCQAVRDRTTSMTVQFDHRHDRRFCFGNEERLETFFAIMPSYSRLVTFSLHRSNGCCRNSWEHLCRQDRKPLPPPTLIQLMDSFPPTLTHLDLDTTGFVPYHGSTSNVRNRYHICKALGNLLAQLQTLRLRPRTLCPHILKMTRQWTSFTQLGEESSSTLRDLAISLEGCDTYQFNCEDNFVPFERAAAERFVVDMLQNRILSAKFPHLKNPAIISASGHRLIVCRSVDDEAGINLYHGFEPLDHDVEEYVVVDTKRNDRASSE